MKLVGYILCAGGIALFFAWPSNAAGLASVFIVAAGLAFLSYDRPASFDDLGRGRL